MCNPLNTTIPVVYFVLLVQQTLHYSSRFPRHARRRQTFWTMGVDVKAVLAYGYVIRCNEFELYCRQIRTKMMRLRLPITAAKHLHCWIPRDMVQLVVSYLPRATYTDPLRTRKRRRTTEDDAIGAVAKRTHWASLPVADTTGAADIVHLDSRLDRSEKVRRADRVDSVRRFDAFDAGLDEEDDDDFQLAWFGAHETTDLIYDIRSDINDQGEEVRMWMQDDYGDAEGEACVLFFWQPTAQRLVDRRAGFTCVSMLGDQVYRGDPDTIRGGARQFLTLATQPDSAHDSNASVPVLQAKQLVDNWFDATEQKRTGQPWSLFYELLGRKLRRHHAKHFNQWLFSVYR